ncbi:protein FAM98A [Latimeria chalumnae]|uniref:protein FAM98A n=1 Tax=Latimeria chalumnae TaxID=7897 RepID=UPI00313EE074
MERDVLTALRALGYKGPLSEEEVLIKASESGALSPEFTCLCAWLVSELKTVCSLEETVSPTDGPDDAETFQLEVSGLVSELQCPYQSLTTGNVTSRLTSRENCLKLLLFLSSELQAARLLHGRQPPPTERRDEGELEGVMKELQLLSLALDMPEPTLDNPLPQLLSGIETKISEALSSVPEGEVVKPLLQRHLDSDQWAKLESIHWSLLGEYECRMRMLLHRFDVTVQSFHWTERVKDQRSAMLQMCSPLREGMSAESRVTLSHLLAAREDMSRVVVVSSGSSSEKTSCAVQKVMMGSVPDRGGRPNEIEAPMPMWESRREGGKGGRQRWGRGGKKHKKKNN